MGCEVVDSVHSAEIRIQWQVLVDSLIKGGKLLDHLGDLSFLRTGPLDVTGLHTHIHTHAHARTSIKLSFGEAEVCVSACVHVCVCVAV